MPVARAGRPGAASGCQLPPGPEGSRLKRRRLEREAEAQPGSDGGARLVRDRLFQALPPDQFDSRETTADSTTIPSARKSSLVPASLPCGPRTLPCSAGNARGGQATLQVQVPVRVPVTGTSCRHGMGDP